MFTSTVAVLDALVPVSLRLVALTEAPVTGFTLTVTSECSGKFAQLTTMGIGLFCCAARIASGVETCPVGGADTGTPPMLVTVNWGNWPSDGMMMNCDPCENESEVYPPKLFL